MARAWNLPRWTWICRRSSETHLSCTRGERPAPSEPFDVRHTDEHVLVLAAAWPSHQQGAGREMPRWSPVMLRWRRDYRALRGVLVAESAAFCLGIYAD